MQVDSTISIRKDSDRQMLNRKLDVKVFWGDRETTIKNLLGQVCELEHPEGNKTDFMKPCEFESAERIRKTPHGL